ncbi:MAG: PKD domain-containing protein, partial [Vicinamibacterales bacterium]
VVMKRILAMAAVVAVAGCSLDKQSAPPLAGPSELGLSLAITATPDIITQDGQSQAVLEIFARDASSQPIRGLTLRAETVIGGQPTDIGTLSSKTISTNSDGKAVLTYRSPTAPPPSQNTDTVVTVMVTPVSNNYAGSLPRQVEIRLARPGIILPPNGKPVPSFFFSPTAPREEDDVFFDGSASVDPDGQIVSYTWTFGDGRSSSSSSPTTRHHYDLAAVYSVVLTVTDDRGQSASSAPTDVTVSSVTGPTAQFAISPTSPKKFDLVSVNASASKTSAAHSIVRYDWDFGDGSALVTGGPQNNHVYTAVGTYAISLKVTDDTGRVAVLTQTVSVAP